MIYVASGVGKVVSGVPASVLVSQGKLDDECDSGNDEGKDMGADIGAGENVDMRRCLPVLVGLNLD